jgi:hypothetical protein
MHIQPVVQTYDVVLTSAELRLIAYGLELHAANAGTVPYKVAACLKMAEKFNNALKKTANKPVKKEAESTAESTS